MKKFSTCMFLASCCCCLMAVAWQATSRTSACLLTQDQTSQLTGGAPTCWKDDITITCPTPPTHAACNGTPCVNQVCPDNTTGLNYPRDTSYDTCVVVHPPGTGFINRISAPKYCYKSRVCSGCAQEINENGEIIGYVCADQVPETYLLQDFHWSQHVDQNPLYICP